MPPSPDTFTSRQHQPGTRMYTDDSCEMPKRYLPLCSHLAECLLIEFTSADILQHLAESPMESRIRGATVTHGHKPDGSTDGHAMYEHPDPADSFESLEAEVDALKANIVMLRGNACSSRSLTDFHQHLAGMTPAQRMQKQHELAGQTAAAWSLSETVASGTARGPPNSSDFPALAASTIPSHAAPIAQAQQRKPSYASAAACSIDQVPAPKTNLNESKIPKPSCDITIGRSAEYDPGDAGPVIVSQAPMSPSKAKDGSGVPRFARPTKSFARRTSETLRRELVNVSPPTGGSPKGVKSGAANTTEKRESPASNKRQSLPSEWLSHATLASQKQSPSASSAIHALPASHGEGNFTIGTAPQQKIENTKLGSQTLQKKTSSYMSPTAATKQRSVAKVADDTKHTFTRARSGNLKLDIHRAKQATDQSHSASASSPDSAVEMTVSTPPSPPKKPYQASHANGHRQEATVQVNIKRTDASLHRDSPMEPLGTGHTAAAAASIPLTPPIVIPNTIVTRRTSHSEMLVPIIDRLDNQGLLRGKLDQAYVLREETPLQRDRASTGDNGRMNRRASKRSNYPQPSENLVEIAHFARQGIAGLRTQATQLQCTPEKPAHEAIQDQKKPSMEATQSLQRSNTNDAQTAAGGRSSPVPCSEKSAFSSLRATAKAFEPFWKPKNDIEELGVLSWSGKLDQYPPEEWAALPNDVKRAIKELRRFQSVSTQILSPASPRRADSPSKRSQQRFWGALKQSEEIERGDGFGDIMACAKYAGHTDPFGSPDNKKMMPPTLSGPKIQDLPDPVVGPAFHILEQLSSPSNMSVSPTSDDSSSLKTPSPGQHHAWTIGAGGYHARPYGWKGGDGHEISFSGYGPQAEMNPHIPVNMLFFPNHRPMRSAHTRGNVFSPSPKVWPRSQKQWAELAKMTAASGMQAVQPCGNMDFVSAAEQFPSVYDRSSRGGFCGDCVPENA